MHFSLFNFDHFPQVLKLQVLGLIQLLKCQTKRCPFPALITFFVKLDQRPKGARRHNYLQFPVSKGRVKAISDISTFCGKYLLTSIYPKNVALAKNYCNFRSAPPNIVKKTVLQCSCHCFCISSEKVATLSIQTQRVFSSM